MAELSHAGAGDGGLSETVVLAHPATRAHTRTLGSRTTHMGSKATACLPSIAVLCPPPASTAFAALHRALPDALEDAGAEFGGTTHRSDAYLRALLIQGTMSVLWTARNQAALAERFVPGSALSAVERVTFRFIAIQRLHTPTRVLP